MQRAGAAIGTQTLDERLAFLKQTHHGAEPDLRCRPGERGAASPATSRLDQPGAGEVLHDLGQMVARQPELIGQLGGREGAFRCARHAHQHPQSVVGEGGEAHRCCILAGIGIYNTY